jgi:microcystin degradation protein MlrC
MKRVGICAFNHESNTFSPTPITREHFEQLSLTKGSALKERWLGTHHELGGFLAGAAEFGFASVPIMAALAIPGGTIAAEAYTDLANEMTDSLKAALPLDGVLLGLHGAAVAENFRDADGEMVRRIREILGPSIPIVMTLDLHANVSPQMIANTDVAVVYRSNPHVDQKQRGLEAAYLMSRMLKGSIHPCQALEQPPLIIHISKQYTAQPPALGLYEDVKDVMQWPGILSASVAMGFYYGDVGEMGASFLAVTDGDQALARKAARWMAGRAWERRQQFVGDLPKPQEAVHRAAQSTQGPVALMDVGDNVGGGSPADSTILFEEILRQKVPNALVILFDPEAVATCVAAGVRKELNLAVGGKTDKMHGKPIRVKGKVRIISDGLFVESKVRHSAWGRNDQGVTVVLETEQKHTIVLTSLRMAPMSLEQILSLGIKPEEKKILIVKGVIAPRAAYEPITGEIIMVDTPGSTSDNPANFEFHHRRKPLYPLESNAEYLEG